MSHGKFSASPRFVDRIVTINWTLLVAALIAWAGAPLAEATPSDLRTQVHELSVTHGFAVQGLHNLGDDPGRRVDGDLREQLNVLLSAFNYVIVADDSGDIDTVMITSRTTILATVPILTLTTLVTFAHPADVTRSVQVTGTAVAKVKPDTVAWTVIVTSIDADLKLARQANDEGTQKVLALRGVLDIV